MFAHAGPGVGEGVGEGVGLEGFADAAGDAGAAEGGGEGNAEAAGDGDAVGAAPRAGSAASTVAAAKNKLRSPRGFTRAVSLANKRRSGRAWYRVAVRDAFAFSCARPLKESSKRRARLWMR
jgi:hypothetical protein